jgi:hypothetical protein
MTIMRLMSTSSRAALRTFFEGLSDAALADVGLRRDGVRAIAAPLLASFTVGASVGVALMLFAAPGSDEARRLLASRVRHARDRLQDAEVEVEDTLLAVRDRAVAVVTGKRASGASSQSPAQG